jgi:hypothetical protein
MKTVVKKAYFVTEGLKLVTMEDTTEPQYNPKYYPHGPVNIDKLDRKIYTIKLYYTDMHGKITLRYLSEEQRNTDYEYIVYTIKLKNNTLEVNNEN